jgi:hypothetical protein
VSVEIRTTALAYEAYVDGVRVGELAFSRQGNEFTALHTEVDPAAGGKGVGTALVLALLDGVRAVDGKVVALCPFVAAYFDRHPELASLRTS